MITINCIKCNIELTTNNTSLSSMKRKICRGCISKINKIYLSNPLNKENKNQRDREYRLNNKDKIKTSKQNWYDRHPQYVIEYDKIYREEHPNYMKEYLRTPQGKIAKKRHEYKHKHGLGCKPLNEWFEGSECHHIDSKNVIFVPKELNHFKHHNVYTSKNMDIVNIKAWDFLEMVVL